MGANREFHHNHYVPEWYQRRFMLPGQNRYWYLDLNPGGFDNAPVVIDDLRIDQLHTDRPETFERALLVGANQPRVACCAIYTRKSSEV